MSKPSIQDKFVIVIYCAFIFFFVIALIVLLIFPHQDRLPPGAVFQTNEAKEWRVLMSDGQVTPVRNKSRVAELAWDYWEVNQCPTNKSSWLTVR